MHLKKIIKYIETHTAGSPTRHLLGGVPRIHGNTMAEKMSSMKKEFDWLRKFSMQEPRGHGDMSGTLYTEPCNPEADMGILYFDACDYMEMCGHSTIAVATILVETGMVKLGSDGIVKLDTPAGLIKARVEVEASGVRQVAFRNVPSFLYAARTLLIEDIGEITVEVAFGGMAYAIVRARDLRIRVALGNVKELVRLAHRVHQAAQAEIGFRHPEKHFIDRIHSVMIVDESTVAGVDHKEVVVCIPSQAGNSTAIDRSPCGTGTSAMLSADYAAGRIDINQRVVNESIIGTHFSGRIVETAKVGNFSGGLPEITGSAYITASGEFILDPRDPIQEGFVLA